MHTLIPKCEDAHFCCYDQNFVAQQEKCTPSIQMAHFAILKFVECSLGAGLHPSSAQESGQGAQGFQRPQSPVCCGLSASLFPTTAGTGYRFWWLKIRALAATGDWDGLEKFSREKSPVGFKVSSLPVFCLFFLTHRMDGGWSFTTTHTTYATIIAK